MPGNSVNFGAPSNEPRIGPTRLPVHRETEGFPHRPLHIVMGVSGVRTLNEIAVRALFAPKLPQRDNSDNNMVIQINALQKPLSQTLSWDRIAISKSVRLLQAAELFQHVLVHFLGDVRGIGGPHT